MTKMTGSSPITVKVMSTKCNTSREVIGWTIQQRREEIPVIVTQVLSINLSRLFLFVL